MFLPSCFPECYSLQSFKSKMNKLDLFSRCSDPCCFLLFPCLVCIGHHGLPQCKTLNKHTHTNTIARILLYCQFTIYSVGSFFFPQMKFAVNPDVRTNLESSLVNISTINIRQQQLGLGNRSESSFSHLLAAKSITSSKKK